MANLKAVKAKIISSKKMGTVTRAMEAVSAVKMRKSQERALTARSYAAAALAVLERLSNTADATKHPLMQEREGKTALIVITSDKGLAGALNSGVIRKAEAALQQLSDINVKDQGGLTTAHTKNMAAPERVIIAAIGRKAAEYFANRGYEVRIRQTNVSEDVSEMEIKRVTDEILKWHGTGEVARCIVVYQNFLSTFEQAPTVRQIVPIRADVLSEMVAGIRPAKGKYAPHAAQQEAPAVYTIEPDADSVLSVLLPRLLNIAVFHALLENKASEHSARMVAMKSATDKAKEMAHNMTRLFNKVRQAAITREVSEITSGIEAMK